MKIKVERQIDGVYVVFDVDYDVDTWGEPPYEFSRFVNIEISNVRCYDGEMDSVDTPEKFLDADYLFYRCNVEKELDRNNELA